MPCVNRFANGSSLSMRPSSRMTLWKKRAYMRCRMACSIPPDIEVHRQPVVRPPVDHPGVAARLAKRAWYHEDSMNVSKVSVSRRARLPVSGSVVSTNRAESQAAIRRPTRSRPRAAPRGGAPRAPELTPRLARDDGDRAPPVALAGHPPVAEPVVDGAPALALRLEPVGRSPRTRRPRSCRRTRRTP